MSNIRLLIAALGYVCLSTASARWASAERPDPDRQRVVVARVDSQPIHLSEVNRLLDMVARGQKISPAARPVLQAQVLAEIVDRRLVLAYAKRTKTGATVAEVDAALAELKSKLESQGLTLPAFLKERSIDSVDLRRQITWNLTWEKYLAKYVTQQRLQSHFDEHPHEFDGTQVSVSHILLRPKADDAPEAIDDLVNKAEAIRREITLGKLSFAEAATRHSAGPSARNGGRLGFIGRHGAMVESFSRAAFALEPGQTSRPITTRFGVHLICCDEIKPGSKEWTEVREPLEKALSRELLDRMARNQQRYTPVEFTSKAPHFKPGTRELVLP